MTRSRIHEMTAEGSVLDACLDYLRFRNIYAWRNNTGALRSSTGRLIRFGHPGSPDILGYLPGGRMLCVECKAGRGRLSELQRNFLGNAAAAGCLVVVAYSVDDLAEALGQAEEMAR